MSYGFYPEGSDYISEIKAINDLQHYELFILARDFLYICYFVGKDINQ